MGAHWKVARVPAAEKDSVRADGDGGLEPLLPGPGAVWLRPEYEGTDVDLVHMAEASRRLGATSSLFASWRFRNPDIFPDAVVCAGLVRWFAWEEMLEFARFMWRPDVEGIGRELASVQQQMMQADERREELRAAQSQVQAAYDRLRRRRRELERRVAEAERQAEELDEKLSKLSK